MEKRTDGKRRQSRGFLRLRGSKRRRVCPVCLLHVMAADPPRLFQLDIIDDALPPPPFPPSCPSNNCEGFGWIWSARLGLNLSRARQNNPSASFEDDSV